MTDFKVGDRVTAKPDTPVYGDVGGIEGTILSIDGEQWPIRVDFDGWASSNFPCDADELKLVKEGSPVAKRQVVFKGNYDPKTVMTVDATWPETQELWLRFVDGTHGTFEESDVEDYVPWPVEGETWAYNTGLPSPVRIHEVTDRGTVVYSYAGGEDDQSTARGARSVESFTERFTKVDG